ncbi:MAG: HAD family hydrolase [Phycisphaeraceae bacterium]|nr:HAD family hydrolase [Phycisphaeraceae bacterium]
MTYQAAIFDLDGTLLDTLTDLSNSANHAMRAVGRPTHEQDAYKTFVGQGVDNLFIDALGPDHQHLHNQAVAAFHAHYADHRFDTTQPYPGIWRLLTSLQDRGIELAVLSNKPHLATVDVIDRYFSDLDWSVVRGHKPGTAPKPVPTSAGEVIAEIGVEPERCVYVGDTKVDMLTGKAAGMFTVGVPWGFRSVKELQDNGADAIVDTADELTSLILGNQFDISKN